MAASALLLALAAVSSLKLPPVDQCAGDPSFVKFRAELVAIAEERDVPAILAALADDVLVDFGGGTGRDAFARNWELDRPCDSRLWEKLGSALLRGCAVSEKHRIAPSSVTQLDPKLDAYTTMIAGRDVILQSAPSDDAPAVARLSWDVLTLVEAGHPEGWFAVGMADGTKGFVRRDAVRSPLDFRIVMERIRGRWAITAFVGGD